MADFSARRRSRRWPSLRPVEEGVVVHLEERMKTMQAEYKTDIALLAKTLAEDNAKRDTEAAKRETRLILALIGIVGAAVAILRFF